MERLTVSKRKMLKPQANAFTTNGTLATFTLALVAGLASGRPAHAQAYTPPPPPLTSAPYVPTKKDPCTQPAAAPSTPATAERFPFPSETPTAGDPPAKPAPKPAGAQPSFPFPGEPAAPAASTDHPFPGEPAEAPNTSSSSSSSSNADQPDSPDAASQPNLKDAGSTGSTRFERKRLARVETPDSREDEDLQVSKYYASTGDYKAAYLRAKDAIATMPEEPEGHFLLADAAQHYNKLDEARAEFAAYLKLDPEGLHVKAAQKALQDMTPK